MNTQPDNILESSVDIGLAEQALKLAKIRQKWNSARAAYAPIVSAFQQIGIEPTMTDAEYLTINMTGDKDALAKAFRILRGAGMTFNADRPKKGDSSWYAFFKHPDTETKLWFQFASSVCRRVKTGTKMVEQDVYETQCGDISAGIEEDSRPSLTIVPSAPELDDVPF